MSAKEIISALKHYISECDRMNYDIVDEMCTADYVCHYPHSDCNREQVKEFGRAIYTAFPDLKHIFEDIIADGNIVAARCSIQATHRGTFMDILPTNRKVTYSATAFFRFQNDKLAEGWVDYDALGLMQQLGMELKPKKAVDNRR